MAAKATSQGVSPQHGCNGLREEREMKRDLALTKHRHNQCEVTASQGWILCHLVHRHHEAIPVHVEAIRIPPLDLHVTGGPNKKRIVDMNRLVSEGQKTGESNEDKNSPRKTPRPWVCPCHCFDGAFIHVNVVAARER